MLTLLITLLMPLVIGEILANNFFLKYPHIPLHSVMETSGGIIAVVIAIIIFVKLRQAGELTYFNWGMNALLTMGIIDIFHASVMPGNLFAWLHSIAVFFGGIFFVTVWLGGRKVSVFTYHSLPLLFAGFAVSVSVASALFPETIPAMFDAQGHFSRTANFLNIAGGIGFFIATVKFMAHYLKKGGFDDLLLAGHTLLFGIAGILFATSTLWDAQWWFWHILRLSAYVVAFYFLYVEYRTETDKIEENNRKLNRKNEEIKKYLSIIDEHVITSTTDAKGIIIQVSSAFCAISGYSEAELLGHSHNIVRHPDMPDALFKRMWEAIQNGQEWHGEVKNLNKNGKAYWVDTVITPNLNAAGEIVGYTSIRQNITNKKEVELLSITDALTGVYNRRHFNEKFTREIRRAKREDHYLSLLILDVDYFKLFNDTYGHQKGDDVLEAIGSVLRSSVRRAGDSAYRLGGEEFGVLFSGLDKAASLALAEHIRQQINLLEIPHEKSTISECLSVSMGLVVQKGDGIDDERTIYIKADDALYRAKKEGRNCIILVS